MNLPPALVRGSRNTPQIMTYRDVAAMGGLVGSPFVGESMRAWLFLDPPLRGSIPPSWYPPTHPSPQGATSLRSPSWLTGSGDRMHLSDFYGFLRRIAPLESQTPRKGPETPFSHTHPVTRDSERQQQARRPQALRRSGRRPPGNLPKRPPRSLPRRRRREAPDRRLRTTEHLQRRARLAPRPGTRARPRRSRPNPPRRRVPKGGWTKRATRAVRFADVGRCRAGGRMRRVAGAIGRRPSIPRCLRACWICCPAGGAEYSRPRPRQRGDGFGPEPRGLPCFACDRSGLAAAP